MVQKMTRRNSVESVIPHSCGFRCLGPLTFHSEAIGELVTLSSGDRLAQRAADSFRNGLVFTSRPVRVRERVRLRVEGCEAGWHGAMRVGFTTVDPVGRALPSLAIPDLTQVPGHWAAPVPESYCLPGSQLEFWVSYGGTIYFRADSGRQNKLLEGVDLSQPLWALIDLYGQTCAVLLLDSKENAEMCVACMSQEASVTLLCGHQCLCFQCTTRVLQEFGTCPLCRHNI
ncbi:E3 ubiquitin-protein ligase NEURL3 [Aplochiton taeniatus]